MRTRALSVLLPGDPETRTGGYIYDRRIVEGLRGLGWHVEIHPLDSTFPNATPAALQHARSVLAGIPDGRIVVIDGLALGGMSSILEAEARRLCLVALIHHPLALETGLDAETARHLEQSERFALSVMRRVIVTSRWTSARLGEYGVAACRIRVVQPGIDARSAVHRDAVGEKPLNLLCVATLIPRKGHAVLFDALASLLDRHWHVDCVGSATRDPATAAVLSSQIRELGLSARIKLVGEINELALEGYYGNADVFVLASYMEGYGMALAEAVAYGLPVVSTMVGAIPETVPADASVLVPPGNSEALAQALARLMDDPATLRQLAMNARLAAKALPTWGEASRKFADALEDLISIAS